jgi:hypothetical protein
VSFLFNKRFQAGEVRLPEHSILVQPEIDGPEWARIQLVHAVSTLAAFLDKMGASQQAQMSRNGWPREGEGLGDAAGRLAALAEEIEHGTTGGVGEGAEGRIRRTCNRMVTHIMRNYTVT